MYLCGVEKDMKEEKIDTRREEFNALGEQPVGKLLMQYAIPAIVAMAASSIYNIIDGIFIGQGVGPEAIMGLALVNPVMSLTAAFGAMVGVGGSTLMSVRLGQKDYKTAQNILDNVLFMNVVMGLTLGLVLQLFLKPILRYFGASDVTIGPAYDFMTVILCGNVVTHLYLGLNAMLRSTNRPRKAMTATIGTVCCNLVLAPTFIFLFKWGIRGAALSTVCSQFIMLCWQIHLFSDKSKMIHIHRGMPNIRLRIIRQALVVGLPQFLINLCACMVAIFITRSLTHFGDMSAVGGDVAVGGYGISNRVVLFIVMIVIGLNQGMQPIAGYNYGAQKYDRLLQVLKKSIIFATIITATGFVVGFVFATPLATLFAKDSPELIRQGALSLRIMVSTFPLVGVQIMSTAFFQSIGYAGKSIFLSLTRQLLFLIPMILLLPHVMDDKVFGVLLSLPAADVLAFTLAVSMQAIQVKKFRKILRERQA